LLNQLIANCIKHCVIFPLQAHCLSGVLCADFASAS
jgi:hypothetical protein